MILLYHRQPYTTSIFLKKVKKIPGIQYFQVKNYFFGDKVGNFGKQFKIIGQT